MRREITEEQITELMQAIPRAEEVDRLRAENKKLRDALTSIAQNTCCGGCQEAARVARNALEGKP